MPKSTQGRVKLIEKQTVELRRLRPLRTVTVVFLKSPAFSKKVAHLFSSGLSNQDVTINDQEWVLSGLISPRVNVRSVETGGVASQVAGFYSNKTKTLYIRNTGQALGIDRWYIAHEYTHALQDQHFNLARVQRDPLRGKIHDSDGYLAEHSLVEGDAVTIQDAYLQKFYSGSDRAALFRQLSSLKSTPLPRALQEQFDFPYSAGPTYVQSLLNSGGYPAVDHAFRHPPHTTYQVMYPGRSVIVRPTPLSRVLGQFKGWKVDDGDVAGAFGYQQLVEQHVSSNEAGELAQMWRGDRYVLIQRGSRYAMLMHSAWASKASALTAWGIIEQAMAGRYGGMRTFSDGVWSGKHGLYGALSRSGSRISIAFARSASLAKALVSAPTK